MQIDLHPCGKDLLESWKQTVICAGRSFQSLATVNDKASNKFQIWRSSYQQLAIAQLR